MAPACPELFVFKNFYSINKTADGSAVNSSAEGRGLHRSGAGGWWKKRSRWAICMRESCSCICYTLEKNSMKAAAIFDDSLILAL